MATYSCLVKSSRKRLSCSKRLSSTSSGASKSSLATFSTACMLMPMAARKRPRTSCERIAGSERPVRRSWPHTESELTTPEMEKKRPLMYSK